MNKLAKYVSIIGHPFITIPIFVIIVMFSFEDFKTAVFISFLIVGCIFVPLISWMYIRTKRGLYTNFDVSIRTQRKSVFVFAVPLLAVVTAIVFATGQPKNLSLGVLFASMLIITSQIVNFYIKSSLHVSLTIYLSFLIMPVNLVIGIIVLLSTAIIGWSRVKLGRHTLKEVFVGMLVGLIISFAMLYFEGYIYL